MELTNQSRVILITGASRGIGLYLVRHYLANGYLVVGCSRSESSINAPNYSHHCLDVTDEKAVKSLFSYIRTTHGKLDILINNAGIAAMNHAMLTPMSTVEKVFSTNVFASFLFSREAAKLMRKKKEGRIVNFSTVAVPLALEGEAIYAASKAAVESLTKVLSKEVADFGITVNALGPTPIQTDLIKNIPNDKLEKLVQQQGLKRYGEMSDVTNVIDFFIRPESGFVTGQILYLGGV